ncbi:MAG: hypothetical protein A2W01_02815 [Candidatus Solincola sediminis]|uniref:CO-methylating acetyl-CoA synthase n=1 Tax=Candidatus Solincola sediminis TaxID=1797199 RepID=A0A1F2WTE0_9ACTN|nr:MAG: hypothetical protein A2W01_02815 [Candidatus Solincola sediminis]OFW60087.1 MAG: hypothetical protein A2Y75_02025 [Candidatus Solincola sediminis]
MLFDETLSGIDAWLDAKRSSGRLAEYEPSVVGWPLEKSVVLKAETGLELGNPLQASMSLTIWGKKDSLQDRIALIGPDLSTAGGDSLPLARLILVNGDFSDEYESYRDLMSAVYGLDLRGVTSRSLPSRHEIWLRISQEALRNGLSLQTMGNALLNHLKQLEEVKSAQIVFVTDMVDILELQPIAEKAQSIMNALVKMYDEMNFDCETCEYVEVCDEVVELRNIRERLKGSN